MQIARSMGYNQTFEDVYTADHPDVRQWTETLREIMKRAVLNDIECLLPKNINTARMIATGWHAFSEIMPWVLSCAATMVSNNHIRHYIIQAAYEELGMRNYNEIHADIFWKSAISINVAKPAIEILKEDSELRKSLNYLRRKLQSYNHDMEVLGILAGLECPAVENIIAVMSAMSYDKNASEILKTDIFFILHTQIEEEHIRLTTANFMRFKRTETDRDKFMVGFNDGLNFWKKFWRAMKYHITNMDI